MFYFTSQEMNKSLVDLSSLVSQELWDYESSMEHMWKLSRGLQSININNKMLKVWNESASNFKSLS